MTCLKYENNISAYLDNELKPKERENLEAHLKSCSSCRAKLETTRELSHRMKELSRLEGDLNERNRLLASLHEKIARERVPAIMPRRMPFRRYALAGASVLFVLILAGLYISSGLVNPTPPPFVYPDNVSSVETVKTGILEEKILDRLVELIKYERLHAAQNEVFSESFAGIYVFEPAPPKEGTLEDTGKINNITG
jgi:hypothetical protein